MTTPTVYGFSTFMAAVSFVKAQAELTGSHLMIVRRVGMFLVGNNWEIKISKHITFIS